MKTAPRCLVATVLAALLLGTLSGCSHRSEASTTTEARPTALAVSTVTPIRQDVPVTIEQPGQIEAFEQTPIYARIGGYVAEVCVDMDARVQKGDCLARLAVPEMEDELRQKQGGVAQTEAELVQVQRTLQTAEANIRATAAHHGEALAGHKRAEANQERADSEYERIRHLVERQVIDRQTHDEARNQAKAMAAAVEEMQAKVRSAAASHEESMARRDKVLADIAVAQTRLQVARRDQEHAQTLLQYAVLQAPYRGVVTRRHVHTGHLLKPGESGNREPLFVVARTDKVRIFIDVPEAYAQLVRPGVPVRVRVQALRDREIDTTVARTSWALDPGNRTLRAEIELDNAADELRPGMYAYAALQLTQRGAWTLPANLVQRGEDAAYCYLLQDGKAVRTTLKLGVRAGAVVEIVKRRTAAETRWHDFTGKETALQASAGALADGAAVDVAKSE